MVQGPYTWDGSPLTWRSFRREMDWWVSSLDLESTKKYNLAAHWLLRQSGPARQRGEEFTPKELEYKEAVKSTDPEGAEITVEEEDLLFGLDKLLGALESINGRTALDKRGELRSQFYLELARRPGERLSEFCSCFRTIVADLKAEGVVLPDSELGWFLKEKLGLDPLGSSFWTRRWRARKATRSSRPSRCAFSRTCGSATPFTESRCPWRLAVSSRGARLRVRQRLPVRR